MFFTMSASVETRTGVGATGDVFAAPVTVAGFLDDGVVREQSASGEVLVARTKFFCALDQADRFAPLSRVTVNGRACKVNYVRRRDADGFGGPSHLEVDLT